DRSLRRLVLKGRDTERPTRAIRFRNVRPAHWRRLVATRLDAVQEVQEIGFQVSRIGVRHHAVDAGCSILAGEPVGLLHPFQIDEVVQRGQRHTSLRSCQFSYPLSFRGQVCEAQGPLPCFPPTVLSTWHPSFLDRVQVSPVPRCHRSYWGATTSRYASSVTYLLRFRGPRAPPCFVSRNLRSRWVGGTFQARVIVRPATRTAGSLARGRERDLPGFQAIHPVPLPRSTTPAEPTTPRLLTVSSMLPPHFPRRRLQRLMNFGALSRGF